VIILLKKGTLLKESLNKQDPWIANILDIIYVYSLERI